MSQIQTTVLNLNKKYLVRIKTFSYIRFENYFITKTLNVWAQFFQFY